MPDSSKKGESGLPWGGIRMAAGGNHQAPGGHFEPTARVAVGWAGAAKGVHALGQIMHLAHVQKPQSGHLVKQRWGSSGPCRDSMAQISEGASRGRVRTFARPGAALNYQKRVTEHPPVIAFRLGVVSGLRGVSTPRTVFSSARHTTFPAGTT